MKTMIQPAVLSPTIIVLALLAAAVVFAGVSGWNASLLSNVRLDIVVVVVLGMAICTQGGIGRVAATGGWSHPLSIVGYLLGGLILLITLAEFTGWQLPWIESDQQALLVIAALVVLKFINAAAHYWLTRA
jgi:hypothetical protein